MGANGERRMSVLARTGVIPCHVLLARLAGAGLWGGERLDGWVAWRRPGALQVLAAPGWHPGRRA